MLNLLKPLHLNTIEKSFKRDSVDLLVESQSSRLEELQKLKFLNLKTELRTHSALLELLEKKELFQEEVLLFFTLKELLRMLKVLTSIKTLVSKL